MSEFAGQRGRLIQSTPSALYVLAAALGVASLVLATWGWRVARRYDDQLTRAARVQAEVLARDFTEEFRLTNDSATARVFGPLRAAEPWDARLLVRLEAAIEEAKACACGPVVPIDGGSFVWTSQRPDAFVTKGLAADRIAPMRLRVVGVARGFTGQGASAFLLKADADGREIIAPVLVERAGGVVRAVGYLANLEQHAQTLYPPVARRVQNMRFGNGGDHLVAWRVIRPGGGIAMELGTFDASAPSVSVAFFRSRIRTGEGDSASSFVAPARSPVENRAGPETLDPRRNPYLLTVQVHPAAVGELLYGMDRGPSWTVFVLLAVTLSLTVATLFIARRMGRHIQEREAFAAAIAHDLRTPLTQILLYAETLTLDRPAMRTRHEAAHVILRETRRLMHLVENALQFVRLGRARPSLNLGPLDLGLAIEETVDALRPILDRSTVQASVVIDDEIIVLAELGAIKQVLMNVIDNAVRFGPSGQTIAVSARQEGDTAIVTIDDEGPGIPARMRQDVFKLFVRAGKSPGSGIGLAVSRQLMSLMNGHLGATSAPTGGARLVMTLPLAPRAVDPVKHGAVAEVAP